MPRTIIRWPPVATTTRRPTSPGDLGEDVLGDVEVGRNALDVLEILEHLHESKRLARLGRIELDRLLRDHRALRGFNRYASPLECLPDLLERARLGVDLDRVLGLGVDVLGSGVDCSERHLIGVDRTVALDRDEAARLELPGDCSAAGELSARLREDRADLRCGPVPIVRGSLDEDRDAARAVALVDDLLELLPVAAAGRLVDRPLDVVGRHVHRAGLLDREPQPVVRVRIPAALSRRNADLAGDLREEGASFRVVRALRAFDRGPFEMPGHGGPEYSPTTPRGPAYHWPTRARPGPVTARIPRR